MVDLVPDDIFDSIVHIVCCSEASTRNGPVLARDGRGTALLARPSIEYASLTYRIKLQPRTARWFNRASRRPPCLPAIPPKPGPTFCGQTASNALPYLNPGTQQVSKRSAAFTCSIVSHAADRHRSPPPPPPGGAASSNPVRKFLRRSSQDSCQSS
ncbi:hypothetical protein EJ03DRAFT_110912 [Teratosphaeria nubilosa]|uniref:Uncharacterized protein n=1 Tax=Teratosphaeria nubilosa TaxID=161662 RepID=A0A6G1L8G8_9PEZI|nr:hypothetical protein EJ03DRAFT_110912 [Teratosphaeria nubilosa]